MKTITAKFIGEDGSLGFRNGSKYRLQVSTSTEGIVVKSTGVLNKGAVCVYVNVSRLLDNWTDIVTN